MMPEISDWRRLIDAAEDAVGLPVRLIWMYKVLIRSTFYYVTTQFGWIDYVLIPFHFFCWHILWHICAFFCRLCFPCRYLASIVVLLQFRMSDLTSPPPGGDQNKAPMLAAVMWSEATIAIVVVILRMYTRARLVRKVGWDDWIMLFTLTISLIASSLDTAGMPYGIGRHAYYLSPANRVEALKLDWLSHAWAIASVTTGKISVAFMLLRISNDKRHMWFLQTVNVMLLVLNIPLIIMTYVQCSPPAILWDPTIKGTCWNPKIQGNYALSQGAINAACDLTYALFPIIIIRKLCLPLKRKLILSSIMCLGVFAAICASIKTFHLTQLTARSDFTFDASSLMIWYTTEMYAIIIAGSIPTLRPLFLVLAGQDSSYSSNRNGHKGYYSHSHELDSHPNVNPKDAITNSELGHTSNVPSTRMMGRGKVTGTGDLDEADSERSILEGLEIRKTTEVSVNYDDYGKSPSSREWTEEQSHRKVDACERV